MKAISIHMHARRGSRPIWTAALPYEGRITSALIALIALGACAYAILVCMSILNVIERKEALAESDRLQSAVGSLEKEYFTLSQTIGPEKAAGLGLTPVSETAYVYPPSALGASDSVRNEL